MTYEERNWGSKKNSTSLGTRSEEGPSRLQRRKKAAGKGHQAKENHRPPLLRVDPAGNPVVDETKGGRLYLDGVEGVGREDLINSSPANAPLRIPVIRNEPNRGQGRGTKKSISPINQKEEETLHSEGRSREGPEETVKTAASPPQGVRVEGGRKKKFHLPEEG